MLYQGDPGIHDNVNNFFFKDNTLLGGRGVERD